MLFSFSCFISILLFPADVSYSKTPLLTQGLILLACLALLAPSMAAPAPTFDPITAASFTAAGGLVCILDIFQQHNLVSQVLTASSGATLTVPTAAILAGKAVAIKGLLLKTLAN